jgi:hypothetical protein
VLDTSERIAKDLFAPHNKKNDQQEPLFDTTVDTIPEVKVALDAFSQAGLMAAGQDFQRGGMQAHILLPVSRYWRPNGESPSYSARVTHRAQIPCP